MFEQKCEEKKAKKIKSDAFRKTKKFASYKGNLRDDPPRPPYKSKLRDDPPHIQKWSKESVEQVDERIDEAFSDIFNERSPSEIAKFKVGSLVFKKQYKLALDALIKVLTRKRTAPVPGQRKPSVKHSISYYAAEIAKSYNHVDGKTLEKLLPKTFVFINKLY